MGEFIDEELVYGISPFFMLGLLLYFNSFNNKFLLDDYGFLNNPVFSNTKFILSQWNPFREQALGILDSHENLGYYRPMTHIVYDFCYATFKDNLWQYHLLNLFLFVFASSLIYLLVEKITGNYNLAFLTGLFYLIHPINGIVVNYISASVFAFQVIFMLGTILLLLGSLERKNNRMLYFLSLVFCFFSLFWHESGIMTPFYIGVVILLFRKDPLKEKALYLLPYFLIVLFYIVFWVIFFRSDANLLEQMTLFHLTGWGYLASQFQILSWYIGKLFYPQGIVMQWSTPILHDHIIANSLGLFLMFLVFLLLFVRFAKEKILLMAIIWVLIGFTPVFLASVIRLYNGIEIEPHWFVFSSIGFFILVAHFCSLLLYRMKRIGPVLLFIIIFVWGSVSYANNQLWADQKTYALYWSQQVPNLKVIYLYLANAYQNDGALKESRKYYKLALSGSPADTDIYSNLGLTDQLDGHLKDAESNYKMALKIDPYSANTYNNLGSLYYAEGQLDKAKKYFDQSLVYNPLQLDSRSGLVFILLKHSEYQKAAKLCFKNLDIKHDDTRTLLLLINIFIRERDAVDLKKYVYRLINFETDPIVLTELGVVLSRNNDVELALDCFTKALHVAPYYKYAYLAKGKLFFNLGKYNEATYVWKLGLSIDPSDQRFKNDITKAIKER